MLDLGCSHVDAAPRRGTEGGKRRRYLRVREPPTLRGGACPAAGHVQAGGWPEPDGQGAPQDARRGTTERTHKCALQREEVRSGCGARLTLAQPHRKTVEKKPHASSGLDSQRFEVGIDSRHGTMRPSRTCR